MGVREGAALAPNPEVSAKARRRRFTAEYKLGMLEQRDAGALAGPPRKRGRKPTRRNDAVAVDNEQLRREAARLRKRLERAELIIEIQKSLGAAGDPPESPRERRGRMMTAATTLATTVGLTDACAALGVPRSSF